MDRGQDQASPGGLTARDLELVERADQLTETELDEVFDRHGVSTPEQFRSLCAARGWTRPPSAPPESDYFSERNTPAQNAYCDALVAAIRDGFSERSYRAWRISFALMMLEPRVSEDEDEDLAA